MNLYWWSNIGASVILTINYSKYLENYVKKGEGSTPKAVVHTVNFGPYSTSPETETLQVQDCFNKPFLWF